VYRVFPVRLRWKGKDVSNLGQLPVVKAPVRSLQHGPLAQQIERNLQQRAALFSDPLIDLRTVRLVLGDVSYSHLRKLIKNGTLKTFRIGKRGHYKVRQSVLEALLAKGDQP
jgi:hypothetical protein